MPLHLKRVQSIQLFFQEGNSDKVYEIDLLESGDDAFLVNFRYGRRGGTLKEGTKTVFPVPYAEALKLYNELETEKRKKGYSAEGENPNFIKEEIPLRADSETAKRTKAIIKNLKAAINEEENETWPLSRIIWRAGELEIKEAAPLILKLTGEGDHLHVYACVWALCRIGDSKALAFFKEVVGGKYPSHLVNLALAALHQLEPEAQEKSLLEKLPQSLQPVLQRGGAELDVYLQDVFGKFGAGSNEYIIYLYLYTRRQSSLRASFIRALKHVPVKAGYFKYIRQLFKIGEMLNDTELYGLLSRKIETAASSFRSSTGYDYLDGKYTQIVEELKRENSRLAFSSRTKGYFERRIVRTLQTLGDDKSVLYTKYATDILLGFDDAASGEQPEKEVRYSYNYDRTARSYNTVEHINWYDRYSRSNSFNFILHKNSTRYTQGNKRWVCVAPYKPGDFYEPLREEAFAALWNNAPDDIIRLLCESRCEAVTDFALHVFRNNSAFKELLTDAHLLAFIKSPSAKVQLLGFDAIKEKYSTNAPGPEVLVALLMSDVAEARSFAQDWIGKDAVRYANDAVFLSGVVLSKKFEIYTWLGLFLTDHPATAATGLQVLNSVIESILSGHTLVDQAYALSLTHLISRCFHQGAALLEASPIFSLLLNSNPEIQGIGGKLLVLRNLEPNLVTDSAIYTLLQSESATARASAVDLLLKLDTTLLAAKRDLVLSLCLSPLADLRQASLQLIDKLLSHDPSAGTGLVNLFMPVLTVKEKYEGLHQDILTLLQTKLSNYLGHVDARKVLALCTSRYVASQELGYTLLQKNVEMSQLPVRDIVRLADSALMSTRELVKVYYTQHADRMKYDKQDSIVLADAEWEDMRRFAFDFFRNQFAATDWEPALFVALCDSLKEDVQAFGREMITRWFEKDKGFEYLLKLSQHPDSRMQLFASGFFDTYAKNNLDMMGKLQGFFITLLSQVNKGHTAKMRAIRLLHDEALAGEENALLISTIFNRMSASAAVQDKALYIKAMTEIRKKFASVNVVLSVKEIPVYTRKEGSHAL